MIQSNTAFLLLAILGGMFLLAKRRKDNLPRIYQWVACLVMTVATVSLLCNLWMCSVRCYNHMNGKDPHGMMMMGGCPMDNGGACHMKGGMDHCKMEGGKCCNMDKCKGEKGGKMECCDDDKGGHHAGMNKDSMAAKPKPGGQ